MWTKTRGARRARRGAVTLSALYMSLFVLGFFCYMRGVYESIARREQLQDAADASAYAAAVTNARGMNTIAFVNMMMAGGVTALAQSTIDETILGLFFRPEERARMARTIAYFGSVSRYVAEETPWLAEAKSARDAAWHAWSRQGQGRRGVTAVRGGFTLSPSQTPDGDRLGLPVEDDPGMRLCEEAAKVVDGKSVVELAILVPRFCPAEGDASTKRPWSGAENGSSYHSVWGFSWASRTPGTFDAAMANLRLGKGKHDLESLYPGGELDVRSSIAVSRAEYYYDNRVEGAKWADYAPDALWNLRWRARFRRVRPIAEPVAHAMRLALDAEHVPEPGSGVARSVDAAALDFAADARDFAAVREWVDRSLEDFDAAVAPDWLPPAERSRYRIVH